MPAQPYIRFRHFSLPKIPEKKPQTQQKEEFHPVIEICCPVIALQQSVMPHSCCVRLIFNSVMAFHHTVNKLRRTVKALCFHVKEYRHSVKALRCCVRLLRFAVMSVQ